VIKHFFAITHKPHEPVFDWQFELLQKQSLACNSEGLSGGGRSASPHLRLLGLPFQKNISGRIQN
jgi:hypothetical protein